MTFSKLSLRPRLTSLSLFISLSSVWLSGCQYQYIIKDPPFERKTYELEHDSTPYTVHINPKSLTIRTQDVYELQELLKPQGKGKASVHVILPIPKNSLEEKKVHAVQKALVQWGLKENRIHIKSRDLAIHNQTMDITFETYRVIPPECGDWHFPLGDARGAMTYPNYGCADVRNFVLMLDDPIVLWRSPSNQDHDTNHDIQAIRDFKTGKPLIFKGDKSDSSTQDEANGQKSSNNG